jgi:hypothetical protein
MSISNNELKDIYIKFKNVLSGCKTIYDALYFAQYYIKSNPECKNLINGMIHGKNYEKISDLRTIAQILNTLNEFKSRNEIDNYINKNIKDNFDYSQINAFLRLGRTKIYNKQQNSNNGEIFKLNIDINNNLNTLVENNQNISLNIDNLINE